MNGIIHRYFVDVVNSPKRRERKENAAYVFERVNPIMDYIRENEEAFRGDLLFIGSAYSKVKVGKADEFDVNVPIRITKEDRKELLVERRRERFYNLTTCIKRYQENNDILKTVPADINVECDTNIARKRPEPGFAYAESYEFEEEFPKLCCDGDIIPILVRKRLKKLIEDGRNKLPEDLRETVRIDKIVHGPALTLDIYKYDDKGDREKITVDFSPVIPKIQTGFPQGCGWPRRKKWPSQDQVRFVKRCFPPNLVASRSLEWEYSYAEAEKALIKRCDTEGYTCRRMAHRIMKKMNEDIWSDQTANDTDVIRLSSYVLKTIFLWECEDFPHDNQWGEEKLWTRVRSMTKSLVKHLDKPHEERFLPQFFDKRLNVLSTTERKKIKGFEICLTRMENFLEEPHDSFGGNTANTNVTSYGLSTNTDTHMLIKSFARNLKICIS